MRSGVRRQRRTTVFLGADGLDRYDGGDGIDTIDYSQIALQMTVDLDAGLAYTPATSHGSRSSRNIENAVGTGFDDVLIGTAGANTLNGGAGNDVLNGGDGDDDPARWRRQRHRQRRSGLDVLDLSDATGRGDDQPRGRNGERGGIGVDPFTGIEASCSAPATIRSRRHRRRHLRRRSRQRRRRRRRRSRQPWQRCQQRRHRRRFR